ncbi:energy-coupling factor transporter transmembrane component T family protein [Selenomonas ruminantium]|uniref:energy-coupling factor transporter transmembrane component T family protein n=1 Tax=Selenomonas ruminantium TaxID=971 RepID=UPI000406BFF4|nr:energy-coupling factor transporter transmembrane component T [Selenomonas ruminantium]
MLNNIMIGQYFPGDSFLHRLDARVKILLLLILLIEVFVFTSAPVYLLMTGITFLLIMTSKVPLRMVLRSLKPLWWIILFTFVLHLFSHPGREIYRIWQFVITQEGVEQGALISVRLMLLIILSTLLTFTTSPLKLTDALESLLSPFKRLGLPAHELAMMMTIALRFIPTLISETDKIMKAQQSRGADFVTGSIMSRLKNMVPILVPLFLSAFRRADDLALAMEARCYRGGEGRTRMKEMKLGRLDYVAIGVFAVLSVGLGVSYGL